MKTFVIVADSRSGGTHVTSVLDLLDGVRCVSEPFNHLKLDSHEKQTAWMERYFKKGASSGLLASGFRTKVKQVADPVQFAAHLCDLDTTLIHLRRTNVLKQAVSSIRAIELYKATGDYNVKGDAAPLPPCEIKPEALKHHLAAIRELAEQEDAFIGALSTIKPLAISYEDLLDNPEEVFRQLQDRLGVAIPAQLKSRTRKNTPDDLRSAILNYDEVVAFLDRTPYRQYL